MAEAIANTDAVHVKGPAVELGLTDRALATFERIWTFTLRWAEKNPLLTLLVLIFLAFAIHERRLGRTELQKMKNEYEKIRQKNKTPPLPLPDPTKNHTGGDK